MKFTPREQGWVFLGLVVLGVIVWVTWPKAKPVTTNTQPGALVTNVGNAQIQEDQFDKPAPDLELIDLKAKSFSLTAHANDPAVALVFWRTDCADCLATLKAMSSLSDTLGSSLYAINVGETVETVEKYVKDNDITTNVLLDPQKTSSGHYATTPLPSTTYIHLGKVVGFGVGKLNLEQLRSKISSLRSLRE